MAGFEKIDRRTLLCAAGAAAATTRLGRPLRASTPSADEPPRAIVNARLHGHADADSLLIRDGKIAQIGERDAIASEVSAERTIDAGGGWVLPGFHDAHLHLRSGGESLESLDLAPHKDLPAALDALARYARERPGGGWLRGRGWQYSLAPDGRFPTRADLDRVAPDRPVALTSFDGHSLWVNSRALEVAEIDEFTTEPRTGRILREEGSRTPSGMLLESAAELVYAKIPPPTAADRLGRIAAGLEHLMRLGLTSVTDVNADPEDLEAYRELLAADRLPLRVSASLTLAGDLDKYVELRRRYDSPLLRIGFLKDFLDGVIESKTAYLLAPYAGTEERGKPRYGRGGIVERVTAAAERGFLVGFHAIGDAAVRLALDAFQEAKHGRGPGGAPRDLVRGRLEHLEVVDPADFRRFAKAGVVASMQPIHANPQGPTPDDQLWARRLGPERLRNSFPWRSLLDAGATLAFGSDWPVMSADPLQGLAVALTRRDEKGAPPEGWNAHQCLTADEAIRAYTEGSAIADGATLGRGRIAAGRPADLVVLAPSVDFSRPETLWTGDRVRATLVDGRLRYDAR